ncbi:hypothetical protein IG193_07615 [Infirmifilum lucidum]|uniref:Uncharacterized protein n=1 Tax=Infirmifilum lucidum TaxID=2776706 RepID=A0A7L9FI65_9CREN|nr:hypothetical protein [Infirmifilum lucidum]QOJ78616.1 hypothetical protein IG193_07615 [Infirmifilum lucidum]
MPEFFEDSLLREIAQLPPRYRDYAYASLARASGRLGYGYRDLASRVRSTYLRSYVLAEMPLYDPPSLDTTVKEVLEALPSLKYAGRVYVLARLAETLCALGRKDYKHYLFVAENYSTPVGYSGKARLAIAFSRCRMVARAEGIADSYSGSRRASLYVELALARPEDYRLFTRTAGFIRGLRDGKKKVVLFSRLAGHPLYGKATTPCVKDLAMKIPLGEALEDLYLSLLVARNLAEAGYSGAVRQGFEVMFPSLPPIDVLPLDFAELILEVLYHYRGLQTALKVAEGSALAPLYYAHLLDYVSMLSSEKTGYTAKGSASNSENAGI